MCASALLLGSTPCSAAWPLRMLLPTAPSLPSIALDSAPMLNPNLSTSHLSLAVAAVVAAAAAAAVVAAVVAAAVQEITRARC